MSDKTTPGPTDVARQLAQHLDSLRAAGVEFAPAASTAQPLPLPTVQTSLFAHAPMEAAPTDDDKRRAALADLAKQVAVCMRCRELASTRSRTVFGVGPIDPDLCFIGEAPGADEDRLGEPFVGAAGQLLTRIIVACGMKREDVFICNVLRCRPPGNRKPLPEEAHNCQEWLEKTLELVRPKYICVLGGTAATHLLGTTLGITKLRGKFFEYRTIPVMCTFHPSYLLRSPEKKKEVWEDMKALLGRMGKPIPGK